MARRPPRRRSLRRAGAFRVVLVTAGSVREARHLAQAVVRRKLAACVNLIPGIESRYWWKGRVSSGKETLLVIKTRASRLQSLYRSLSALHSYEVPEFLALPIAQGSGPYLDWLQGSLR